MTTVAGQNAPEARELSAQEQEAEAKLCYALHRDVVVALNEGRAALWKLAEALTKLDDHAAWKRLGYDTKGEWLADPEVGITQRTYTRYIRAWRVLHERYGVDRPTLAKLDASKVDIVLPAVQKGSKSVNDAIDDVQTLGARDLREMYWGAEDGQAASPPPPESEPDQEPTSPVPDGSGPVRASDGAPVDLIFDSENGNLVAEVVDGEIVEPTEPERTELADEEPVQDLDAKHYVRCTHCGGIVAIDDAEKAEPPPT